MTTTPKPDGGPAFPHSRVWHGAAGYDDVRPENGMSLRDWFAGQALVGYMAHDFDVDQDPREWVGRLCYAYADAMIAAREADQ